MFYAKPSGTYAYNSTEGTANIKAVYDYLHPEGYTKASIIGILGNIEGESGYNPWYWQNNTYAPTDPNAGYGLLQFTPAYDYLNVTGIPNHAPNLSTSQQTAGADPNDAKGQLYCFVNDTFNKWYSPLWRSYWSPTDYPDLYTMSQAILNQFGSGGNLSQAQFMQITDYQAAVMAFLGCYEGPLIPNYTARKNYADNVKTILDNYDGDILSDILFMKKIRDNNFNVL